MGYTTVWSYTPWTRLVIARGRMVACTNLWVRSSSQCDWMSERCVPIVRVARVFFSCSSMLVIRMIVVTMWKLNNVFGPILTWLFRMDLNGWWINKHNNDWWTADRIGSNAFVFVDSSNTYSANNWLRFWNNCWKSVWHESIRSPANFSQTNWTVIQT